MAEGNGPEGPGSPSIIFGPKEASWSSRWCYMGTPASTSNIDLKYNHYKRYSLIYYIVTFSFLDKQVQVGFLTPSGNFNWIPVKRTFVPKEWVKRVSLPWFLSYKCTVQSTTIAGKEVTGSLYFDGSSNSDGFCWVKGV